jgi:hypothetical protein
MSDYVTQQSATTTETNSPGKMLAMVYGLVCYVIVSIS